MKERMQLVAGTSVSDEGEFFPMLHVYNSLGHKLGTFKLDDGTGSYDTALASARQGVVEYAHNGRMVNVFEAMKDVLS
jgi:hypothetical protein